VAGAGELVEGLRPLWQPPQPRATVYRGAGFLEREEKYFISNGWRDKPRYSGIGLNGSIRRPLSTLNSALLKYNGPGVSGTIVFTLGTAGLALFRPSKSQRNSFWFICSPINQGSSLPRALIR